MKNIDPKLKKIFLASVILLAPAILIFILNLTIICFTLKTNNKIPLILIDLNEGMSVSDYISAYIGVLGIEVTAMLTWVIYKLTISREDHERNQERNEKIKSCRNKVYTNLTNSLDYIFQLYLKSIFPTLQIQEKSILIDDNWDECISHLDLNSKYIELYRDLYIDIINIKHLLNIGKGISKELEDIIRKITKEFYYYYCVQLGEDIYLYSIMNKKYIEAMHMLEDDGNAVKGPEGKYMNGNTLCLMQDNKFTAYDKTGNKLCNCSFENYKPSTGYAILFNDKNKLIFEGKIENGNEVEGIFFDCTLDVDDKPVIVNKKPVHENYFHDNEEIKRYRITGGTDCAIANFRYENNQFTIDKNSIRAGKRSIF